MPSLATLASVADVFNGKTPAKGDQRESGFPVLKIRDVDAAGRFKGTFESFVEPAFANRFAVKHAQIGDVLVLNAAHNASHVASKTHRVEDGNVGALITGEWLTMRPDVSQLEGSYLAHWVTSAPVRAAMKDCVKGIHLYPKDVAQLKIPLPPLPEQRRIAAILDHADTLRAKRLEAVAVFAELTGSLFRERFGDPRSNPKGYPSAALKTIVRQGDKINYGVVQPGGIVEGGVPLIRAGDLEGGEIDQAALRTISVEVDERHKRSRLRGDELLISCVGSIGTVAPASPEVAGYNIARAVARVPLGPSVDRGYVAAWLRTEAVQDYFRAELRTVAQPTLNIKQIELLDVILPPLKEQRAFANELSKLATVRASMTSECLGLDALFSSLQGRAFRGEL